MTDYDCNTFNEGWKDYQCKALSFLGPSHSNIQLQSILQIKTSAEHHRHPHAS